MPSTSDQAPPACLHDKDLRQRSPSPRMLCSKKNDPIHHSEPSSIDPQVKDGEAPISRPGASESLLSQHFDGSIAVAPQGLSPNEAKASVSLYSSKRGEESPSTCQEPCEAIEASSPFPPHLKQNPTELIASNAQSLKFRHTTSSNKSLSHEIAAYEAGRTSGRGIDPVSPNPGSTFINPFSSNSTFEFNSGDVNQSFIKMIGALACERSEDASSEDEGNQQPIRDKRGLKSSKGTESSASSSSGIYSNQELPTFRAKGRLHTDSPLNHPSMGKGGRKHRHSKSTDKSPLNDPSIASSLHALHRPIAARRRTETGESGECALNGQYISQGEFEHRKHTLADDTSKDPKTMEDSAEGRLPHVKPRSACSSTASLSSRTSSKASSRKLKLAEKLEDIFGLETTEVVLAEFHCWLFRSVLLQGHLYVTTGHICFYAYLPYEEGAVIRSGPLSVRGAKTRRYFKRWFILKDAVFSWYPSSTDPYFRDGHIDLHYCINVEASVKHKAHFRVLTAEKKWHFSADSEANRDEWVKTIKKVVFRCQNEGASVKIAIPLETIVNIEKSSNLQFAETIRIRVYDAEEGFSIDEYWLSYFPDIDEALRITSKILEDFRHRHLQPREKTVQTRDTGKKSTAEDLLAPEEESISHETASVPEQHTYPPQSSTTPETRKGRELPSWAIPSILPLPVPSVRKWLTQPPLKLFAGESVASCTSQKGGARKLIEVVTQSSRGAATKISDRQQDEDDQRHPDYSKSRNDDRDAEDSTEEETQGEAILDFRSAFGMAEKEQFRALWPGYLFRGLPIYGKIYLSENFLCFKSAGILTKTRMILPLVDIIDVSMQRSYQIGYSGMIVVIKGHEELFFELKSSNTRDECMLLLQSQKDHAEQQLYCEKTSTPMTDFREHQDLLDLATTKTEGGKAQPRPPPETEAGQAPIMFSSTSSDFVTFRPERSLRFTCLTIGSRGDIQPYIALCKGLMAEGHLCKIASHAEYQEWVTGHGIGFESIGGDPSQLMELMIAHDFFTLSFMREAIGHFRGWLDDLLESSWLACQNTDVLIESPSAIAGYHIAEALRIPYFRAFTMPWSRTRAYPHAFAVPDSKMGGGYNYMTYTMFDQIFWRATSGQVNQWRKKSLNIGSTNLDAMQQHKIPFLYNFSPVIVPPPLDWRENIHVTGYWWLDNPEDSSTKKWEPPQDLLDFLAVAKAQGKKLIFIGFGSIIIPDPKEMTRIVTEAVKQADVYAVIAKGWSDRVSAKDDSKEQKKKTEIREQQEAAILEQHFIYNVKSIPHDWLFPRIDAAVHHGGAGTTGASLRAGLPTIIKPFFGDQHFYAERVASLGIGSSVRVMTVERLSEAITMAVTDDKQIARAKLAGENIRKEDGVSAAITCIYRDLEYARSLIPSENRHVRTTSIGSSGSELLDCRKAKNRHNSSFSSPRCESTAAELQSGVSDEDWDVL